MHLNLTRAFLLEVLASTEAGVLQWNPVRGYDRVEAALADETYSIEFRYPLYSDEGGADRDVVYFRAGGLGPFRFFYGTEEMSIIWRILAVRQPTWQEHWVASKNHIIEAMNKLEQLRREKQAC